MAVSVYHNGSTVRSDANIVNFKGNLVDVVQSTIDGNDAADVTVLGGVTPVVETAISHTGTTTETLLLTDTIDANAFASEGFVEFDFSAILNAGLLSVGNYFKVTFDDTLIAQHSLGSPLGVDHPIHVRGKIVGKGTDSQHYFIEVIDGGNGEPVTTTASAAVRTASGSLTKDDASTLNIKILAKLGLTGDVFTIHQYTRRAEKP